MVLGHYPSPSGSNIVNGHGLLTTGRWDIGCLLLAELLSMTMTGCVGCLPLAQCLGMDCLLLAVVALIAMVSLWYSVGVLVISFWQR